MTSWPLVTSKLWAPVGLDNVLSRYTARIMYFCVNQPGNRNCMSVSARIFLKHISVLIQPFESHVLHLDNVIHVVKYSDRYNLIPCQKRIFWDTVWMLNHRLWSGSSRLDKSFVSVLFRFEPYDAAGFQLSGLRILQERKLSFTPGLLANIREPMQVSMP